MSQSSGPLHLHLSLETARTVTLASGKPLSETTLQSLCTLTNAILQSPSTLSVLSTSPPSVIISLLSSRLKRHNVDGIVADCIARTIVDNKQIDEAHTNARTDLYHTHIHNQGSQGSQGSRSEEHLSSVGDTQETYDNPSYDNPSYDDHQDPYEDPSMYEDGGISPTSLRDNQRAFLGQHASAPAPPDPYSRADSSGSAHSGTGVLGHLAPPQQALQVGQRGQMGRHRQRLEAARAAQDHAGAAMLAREASATSDFSEIPEEYSDEEIPEEYVPERSEWKQAEARDARREIRAVISPLPFPLA